MKFIITTFKFILSESNHGKKFDNTIKGSLNELCHKIITKKKHVKEMLLEKFVCFFCATVVVIAISTPNAKVIAIVFSIKFPRNLSTI